MWHRFYPVNNNLLPAIVVSMLLSSLLYGTTCRAEDDVPPIRIIVTYRDDSYLEEALQDAVGDRFNLNITSRNILSFNITNRDILQRIIDNPKVEFAEIDPIQEKLVFGDMIPEVIEDNFLDIPTRDFEITPYGIPMVQSDLLKEIPVVDPNMTVCVVDTGMNLGHSDLPTLADHETTGTSTESGKWFVDVDGHGTHTAGTVGAIGNNSIGVVGVRSNPNLFHFHIGRGLGNDGSGYDSVILDAVQGCIDRGAKVVSMSLGGSGKTNTAKKFYKSAWEDDGILIIAAAGNSGDTGDLYPASYKHVMSVAAVDKNGLRPGFSQCNSQVEISAPGVGILSTVPDGYAIASGTSMACPHVAGVAAEVWSRFPECTNSQIRNVLLRSSKFVGEVPCCNQGYGSGLVQAKAAYDLLAAEGCGAGGEASANPDGGCKQNPDYDGKSEYEKVCVSAGHSSTRDHISSLAFLASVLSSLFLLGSL